MNYDGPLSGILLLSDIDGTLLPENGEIPENNISAIEKFKTLGGTFGLCTGRSMESARWAVSNRDLTNCPSIVYNGGAIYDFRDDRLLKVYSLPAAARCKVFEIMRTFPDIGVEVHIDCRAFCLQFNELSKYHMLRETSHYHVTPIADLPSGEWNKVVFVAEEQRINDLIAYAGGVDTTNEDFYFLRSDKRLYELLPKSATKGNALITLGGILNIDNENIYAIGDYYNDIDLLKAAGVAVTVASAPEEIKRYADYITCECSLGAVADLVEHIIAERAV